MSVELGSGCLNMETEFMFQNVKSGKCLLRRDIRNGQYFLHGSLENTWTKNRLFV